MEEARYSLNIPLPKASQYDPTTGLTIRADSVEEFEERVNDLFGDGTLGRLSALALVTLNGVSPVQGEAVTVPTVAVPIPAGSGVSSGPAPARAVASGPAAPQGDSFGACPQCGQGTLVKKFRKAENGGGFMGVGCNNFPACQYMQYWAPRS